MNTVLRSWMLLLAILWTSDISAQVSFESSHLPIVIINSLGQTIPDEPKITADMGIIDNGPGQINNLTDSYNNYDGKIGIEIRGSSSQSFPKKQYGIETRDSNGEDLGVELLGFPEEDDWVLYAPYSDKSLLRNVITYRLGNVIGRYASRTRLVEVVINDQYQGVFVLMEKIKRDKNRVDISKLEEDEIAGDDLTGGYIVKIDKFTGGGGEGWTSPFPSRGGLSPNVTFQYEYPKADDIVPEQQEYIENYITAFEEALKGPDFLDATTGYKNWADIDSFVDFIIINELTKNVDGYRLSTFMYKDKDSNGGKLTMGPLWDFNLAFGNADYCEGSITSGWGLDFNSVCSGDNWQIPFWWDRLLQDPEFTTKLNDRWDGLRATTLSDAALGQMIDDLSTELGEATGRNFERWPVLNEYVWPNNFVGGSYDAEINYLKSWIEDRTAWIDDNLPGIARVVTATADPLQPIPFELYPVPLENQVFFKNSSSQQAQITVLDAQGHAVHELVLGPAAQTHDISWDRANPAGLYIFKVQIGETFYLRKTVKL